MTLLLVLLPMLLGAPTGATDLTGAWTFEWTPDFGGEHPNTHECELTQRGQALTIRCDEQAMKGTIKGKTVTFSHTTGLKNEQTATYKATLDGKATSMTGSWHLSPVNKNGKFEAHKH